MPRVHPGRGAGGAGGGRRCGWGGSDRHGETFDEPDHRLGAIIALAGSRRIGRIPALGLAVPGCRRGFDRGKTIGPLSTTRARDQPRLRDGGDSGRAGDRRLTAFPTGPQEFHRHPLAQIRPPDLNAKIAPPLLFRHSLRKPAGTHCHWGGPRRSRHRNAGVHRGGVHPSRRPSGAGVHPASIGAASIRSRRPSERCPSEPASIRSRRPSKRSASGAGAHPPAPAIRRRA